MCGQSTLSAIWQKLVHSTNVANACAQKAHAFPQRNRLRKIIKAGAQHFSSFGRLLINWQHSISPSDSEYLIDSQKQVLITSAEDRLPRNAAGFCKFKCQKGQISRLRYIFFHNLTFFLAKMSKGTGFLRTSARTTTARVGYPFGVFRSFVGCKEVSRSPLLPTAGRRLNMLIPLSSDPKKSCGNQ